MSPCYTTESKRLEDEAIASEAEANDRADALWAIEELTRFWTVVDHLAYARTQDRPVHVWWLEQAHAVM